MINLNVFVMKKLLNFVVVLGLGAAMFSCGGQKQVAADYYNNPRGNYSNQQTEPERKVVETTTVTATKRAESKLDLLAAEESTKLRAVGIGNDYEEKYARREAIRDAQATLAGYLERSIIEIVKEYNKRTTKNDRKKTESQLEGYVETTVAQIIKSHPIGVPEIYDLSDGTVRVYVCVELDMETTSLLEDTYNKLSDDEVIGVDYDKKKFIEDNLQEIERLRNEVKQ